MNALVDTQEEPENEFDAAMKKLVNVDRIDEPASAHLKLTMIREAEGKKIVKGKSRPIPPAAHGMIGGNATLQQIKSVHPVSTAIEFYSLSLVGSCFIDKSFLDFSGWSSEV
jgi:hypothetical protein